MSQETPKINLRKLEQDPSPEMLTEIREELAKLDNAAKEAGQKLTWIMVDANPEAMYHLNIDKYVFETMTAIAVGIAALAATDSALVAGAAGGLMGIRAYIRACMRASGLLPLGDVRKTLETALQVIEKALSASNPN